MSATQRKLRTLVIFMGFLIIVGSVVLVVGLVNQIGGAGGDAKLTKTDFAKAPVMKLGLPKSTLVRRMIASGERLFVHVSVPGEGDWIYVVPLAGGPPLKISLSGLSAARPGKTSIKSGAK
jgi:hypothetical protein